MKSDRLEHQAEPAQRGGLAHEPGDRDTAPEPGRGWRTAMTGATALFLTAGLAYGVWSQHQPLLELLHRTGQRLAGMGQLGWEDAKGEWHEVARADAARLSWSADTAFLTPTWVPVMKGLDTADLTFARPPHPQTVTLTLARVDPSAFRIRVVGYPDWVEHPVTDFAKKWDFVLAINASYFSTEEGPIGVVVQDNKLRHRQASRKAAHFVVDGPGGAVRIVNQKHAPLDQPYAAFQGFPSIMRSGTLFDYIHTGGRGFDVFEVDRRSGACTDRDGKLLLMATDSLTNGLSLSELGVIMGGLGCVDGMGFDGGSSTAMEIRVKGHRRHVAGLKPVQVVLGLSPLSLRTKHP